MLTYARMMTYAGAVHASCRHVPRGLRGGGTQFMFFTSTKVQILTPEALLLQFDVTVKAEATIKIASLPPVYADVC